MSVNEYDIEGKYRISIKKFRAVVDAIKDPRDSTLIKVGYLGAFRGCELITKTGAAELLRGKSKPYGTFQDVKLEDYIIKPATDSTPAQIEKILVIRSAIAKRAKRMKRKKDKQKEADDNETLTTYTDEELTEAFMKFQQKDLLTKIINEEVEFDSQLVTVLLSKIKFKSIGIPVNPHFEPWAVDLLRYMSKVKKKAELTFDLTRKTVWQIMRKRLDPILPSKSPKNLRNPLRHYRTTHLDVYYRMPAQGIQTITGWTARTAYGAQGMAISSNYDRYVHKDWRSYIDHLLIPILQFL